MEKKKTTRQFGLWDSPIKPLSLAQGIEFSEVTWDDSGALVWLEKRSDRNVLVVQEPGDDAARELNREYSVRARVGYGGGDYTVGHGQVYFVEAESGRIFRQPLGKGIPRPITPAFGGAAALKLSPDGRWLLFVHRYEGQDSLAIVDSQGEYWPHRLVKGDDFYMQPAWHPDGERFAWVTWNHPNMPWDGTVLKQGRLDFTGGFPRLAEQVTIAGDEDTSLFQPEYSPDGRSLAYVSDASGWWQIYLYNLQSGESIQITAEQAEHGLPAWVHGLRTYSFDPTGERLFFLRNREALTSLWRYDLSSGEHSPIPLPVDYTALDQPAVSLGGDQIALLASGGSQPQRVITLAVDAKGSLLNTRVRARGTSEEISQDYYSTPQYIHWRGLDGDLVYGLFYEPSNPDFDGQGKPPLIVNIHGGPTSQRRAAFEIQVQFFCSRGYAFLDVNYRGSTGYGRAYRNLLRGNWGIYDVQDAVSGVRHLAEEGLIDDRRAVIMGGSAGGFTVLKALVDHPGFFQAGICRYGISNQFALAAETHKFEAHYSDALLGPLPEAAKIYRQRSPIFFVDRIEDPLALFQGEDDQVVPRQQSDELVASLRKRDAPHVYHVYPGEGHGFRKSETVSHYYRAVEEFLRDYVIFS